MPKIAAFLSLGQESALHERAEEILRQGPRNLSPKQAAVLGKRRRDRRRRLGRKGTVESHEAHVEAKLGRKLPEKKRSIGAQVRSSMKEEVRELNKHRHKSGNMPADVRDAHYRSNIRPRRHP